MWLWTVKLFPWVCIEVLHGNKSVPSKLDWWHAVACRHGKGDKNIAFCKQFTCKVSKFWRDTRATKPRVWRKWTSPSTSRFIHCLLAIATGKLKLEGPSILNYYVLHDLVHLCHSYSFWFVSRDEHMMMANYQTAEQCNDLTLLCPTYRRFTSLQTISVLDPQFHF